MSFVACWLNDEGVVAEETFDDLLMAQAHILQNSENWDCLGATCVKVRDEHWVYFEFRPGSDERSSI